MTNLRWVLLGLGILVLLGVYLWGKGWLQKIVGPLAALRREKRARPVRVEPAIAGDVTDADAEPVQADQVSADDKPAEKVVTLRFIPNGGGLAADKVILALRAAGLKHGRFGIFHKHADEFTDEPVFSVANLTEPGSFDLSNLSEGRIAGMSFFMVLPGTGSAIESFDSMIATARDLARKLDAELRDEKGSSWSIQRERYIREEIIEYQHMLDRLPRA